MTIKLKIVANNSIETELPEPTPDMVRAQLTYIKLKHDLEWTGVAGLLGMPQTPHSTRNMRKWYNNESVPIPAATWRMVLTLSGHKTVIKDAR